MNLNAIKKIIYKAYYFYIISYALIMGAYARAQDITTENPIFSERLADKMQRWSSGFAQKIGFNVISLPGVIALLIFVVLAVLSILFIALVFYGGKGGEDQALHIGQNAQDSAVLKKISVVNESGRLETGDVRVDLYMIDKSGIVIVDE